MSKVLDVKKREQAFLLYGKYRNIKEVAEQMGVDGATISRWRREDNWENRLLDTGRRLKGMLAVLDRAKNDLVLADMVSEINFLELMETYVSQAIAIDGIRPKNWNEVLSTMKFVTERKDKIFGKASDMQDEMEGTKKTEKPSDNLTEDDKEKLFALKNILKSTSNPIDLTATEYTPVAVEERKDENKDN